EIVVLNELVPLIDRGFVRFGQPDLNLCDHHLEEARKFVFETAKRLFTLTKDSIEIYVTDGPTNFDYYEVLEPIIAGSDERLKSVYHVEKEESRKTLRRYRRGKRGKLPKAAAELVRQFVENDYCGEVQELLQEVNIARLYRGRLVTGSQRDALLLHYVNEPKYAAAENWE